MAKQENFNALISSIQEVFLQVNKLSEMQHLDMLKNYFDENGDPICIDIHYPHFDEAGTLSYYAVSVPRLCLVPITSLKLNEVLVDFKVKLYGKVQLKEATKKNEPENLLKASSNPDAATGKSYLGYIPGGFGARSDNGSGYANIRLKFTSEQPPEGVMRISDELTKIML